MFFYYSYKKYFILKGRCIHILKLAMKIERILKSVADTDLTVVGKFLII